MHRIVSLVPSQTELLYDLGLEDEVIGITKFCIHPGEWFRKKTRVGGTKTVDVEKIKALQPTLIIANKEENVKEQVNALRTTADVYVSDIANLDDALQMIRDIGSLTGKVGKAEDICTTITCSFDALRATIQQQDRTSTAYLIWRDPYMAAGGDTFINDMLQRCGFENVFAGVARYPEVSIDRLSASRCELLLLSSEPYPFKQKHIDDLQQQLPGIKIMLADGEMFSWYGSRLTKAAGYFQQLRNSIFQ
jgi:ABC-type Fe3+-hydroxamate transport system substrate-binding protein